MSAYVIYRGTILDEAQYSLYRPRAAASIEAAGGRYLVRGGAVETLEGDDVSERIVVVEFPSRQAAIDWYHGEAYADARRLRAGAARAEMFVVDGVDEPAP